MTIKRIRAGGLKLRGRIVVMVMAVTLVMSVISSVLLYQNTNDRLIDTYINSALSMLEKDAQNVRLYLEQFNALCAATFLDDVMAGNIVYNRTDLQAREYAEGLLRQLCYGLKEIDCIYLYIPATQLLYTIPRLSVSTVQKNGSVEDAKWYKLARDSSSLSVIGPIEALQDYSKGVSRYKADRVFTFNRAMRNVRGTVCQAVLSLHIDPDRLIAMMSADADAEESVALINADGTLFAANGSAFSPDVSFAPQGESGSVRMNVDGREYLTLYASAYEDMVLRKSIPLDVFAVQARKQVMQSLMILLLSILLLMSAILVLVNHYVIMPVRSVSDTIAQMKNGARFPVIALPRRDEIGALASTFNEMSESMDRLINSDYANRLLAQNAQIAALRAQINPHYMNNLLQSIGSLALEHDNMEVYDAIRGLAELMRYSCRSDRKTVPLDMELDYVRQYVALQKIRFGDSLDFSIDAQPEAEGQNVPTMILQPIVENSIDHGFKSGAQRLSVRVKALVNSGRLILAISDDGKGFDPDTLAHVRRQLSRTETMADLSEHIGLYNVYLRLCLIFGTDVSFEVLSAPGEGTTVEISFMCREVAE